MTSTRQARPASRWMGLVAALCVATPGLAHAHVLDLVYERTVIAAASARVVVAAFADRAAPDAARLLVRDEARSSGPYRDRVSQPVRGLPLDRRLPPRAALRAFPAEARSAAGTDLLPKEARSGWAFR